MPILGHATVKSHTRASCGAEKEVPANSDWLRYRTMNSDPSPIGPVVSDVLREMSIRRGGPL